MAKRSEITALKALFIGNSFTARNNVPGLIEDLAAAHSKQFEHQLIQAGGASLRMHWNKGEAQQEIQRTRYDYVVLQEQSTLPVKNAVRFHENVRLFAEAIKAAGAKTVLYLTWARQNALETQVALTAAYESIGAELGALIVPVGTAWQLFLQKHKQPVLHDKDQSHPTLAGSYLAACVFYAVLFKDKPTGEPQGLSPAEAALLQQTAWEAVQP
jgi:hypothetical protein